MFLLLLGTSQALTLPDMKVGVGGGYLGPPSALGFGGPALSAKVSMPMDFGNGPVELVSTPVHFVGNVNSALLRTPGCDTCTTRTTTRFGTGVGFETPFLDVAVEGRVVRFREEGSCRRR